MVPLTDGITPCLSPPASALLPNIAVAAHVEATSSAMEYACYVHQLLYSPPASTLLRALDKSTELHSIPGLTPNLIRAHLPRSTATDKGHMQCQCSNTASTQNARPEIIAARNEVNRMFPTQEACAIQDVFCFTALANVYTGTMYTNLTGAFPVRFFKNMQYIFVAYI
jgi:hypothetical protein